MKSFEQFLPAARFDAALNASSMTGHLPNRLDVRKSAKSLQKKNIQNFYIRESIFIMKEFSYARSVKGFL